MPTLIEDIREKTKMREKTEQDYPDLFRASKNNNEL